MLNKIGKKRCWKKPRLIILNISSKTNNGTNMGYDGETSLAGGGGS
jgi:hypothetical protein